jgi:hypothetical protein
MSNATVTEFANRNSPVTKNILDLAGLAFAGQVSALPGLVGKVGKLKNFKVTNNASAGTVTTITLPTGTYALKFWVVTATAIVAYAFGADTPAVGTNTVAVGGVAYTSERVDVLVPESETSLKLVSDTNSAVILVTAYIA